MRQDAEQSAGHLREHEVLRALRGDSAEARRRRGRLPAEHALLLLRREPCCLLPQRRVRQEQPAPAPASTSATAPAPAAASTAADQLELRAALRATVRLLRRPAQQGRRWCSF